MMMSEAYIDKPFEAIDRDDVLVMLRSADWRDNVIAVYVSLRKAYFDEEVADLVIEFSDSNYAVPFDLTLSELVAEYFEARGRASTG